HNAIVAPKFLMRSIIAEIISFHVTDRNAQNVPFFAGVCKRRVGILHAYMDGLANVFQSCVPQQRAGQQSCFAKNLKSVTDSKHESATVRKLAHRFHHRRKSRNRSRSQVITIREAAGDNDRVAVLQIVRFMPQKSYRLLNDMLDRPESIVVAVGTRENDDAKLHGFSSM